MKPLLHPKRYMQKVLASLLVGFIILFLSVLMGVLGYHYYFELGWVDSLYNASMILTGMGPVDRAPNDAAKIFGSLYALYSGVAFLTCVAIILSPVVHRFLHKFRLDIEE